MVTTIRKIISTKYFGCEDSLSDKAYFEEVYKEACELTAYLCKEFNLDPKGTSDCDGVKTPVILCHADAHKLGLGSNHGDVLHWFGRYGKTMDDVRNDVAALMDTNSTASVTPKEEKEIYRIRTDWEDSKSQVGAYSSLASAKKACDAAGPDYFVFDENGNTVYPEEAKDGEEIQVTKFAVGDVVKLTSDAKYASGQKIPDWLKKSKLYIREIKSNGNYTISTQKTGAITGVVPPSAIVPYTVATPATVKPTFIPYLIKVTASTLNVRAGAGTSYKVTTTIEKNGIYTIIDEKNGWGKLKSGAGWISLKYTKKV